MNWQVRSVVMGAFCALSGQAVADFYLGVGGLYTQQKWDNSVVTEYSVTHQTEGSRDLSLDRSPSETVAALFMGYQFSPRWGLELQFSETEQESGIEQPFINGTESGEHEWNAQIDHQVWALTPVYYHAYSSDLRFFVKAGLTFETLKQSQSSQTDIENGADRNQSGQSSSDKTNGLIVGAGADYQLMDSIALRGEYQYRDSDFARAHQLFLGAYYAF
ncbi:MAG: porin family protein [Thiotrichales bacterium]|nr:porin family protein [Thiotrichales bacterium]